MKLSVNTKPDSFTFARRAQSTRAGRASAAVDKGLSQEMLDLLKKFIITLRKGEHQVETQRQRLAKLEKFEPYAAFQRIDRDWDGQISSVDILRFLRQNKNSRVNEQDCSSLVNYFAGLSDGILRFKDFLQIIMPCDSSNLRASIAQRPNYEVSESKPLPA